MGVLERTVRKYNTDGLSSLSSTAVSFCRQTVSDSNLAHYDQYGPLKYPVSLCDRVLSLQLEDCRMDRDELRRCCIARSRFWEFGSQREFEISYAGDGAVPDGLKEFTGTTHVSRPFVCELNNCRLFGSNALVATTDGDIVSEPLTNHPVSFRTQLQKSFREFGRMQTLRHLNQLSTERTYDTVFHLVARGPLLPERTNPNYAHWLLEHLPKLRALEHYREITGREPAVLIDQHLPEWALKRLRMMGVSDDQLIEWTEMSATVSRLVIPTTRPFGSTNIEPDPAGHRVVRDRLRSKADSVDGDRFANRIFLSRQGMPFRYVTNYQEVFSILESFGFESYRPETLSLSEQIALFSSAETIVGLNGAAFANLIFADDTTVNTIQPGVAVPNWYVLANEFDIPYRCMIGTTVNPDRALRRKNVHVDTDALRDFVSAAI